MKKYLLISILISFIVSGCIGRESLFDKASVDPSDVPKIIAYDPHEALTEIPENTIISVLFSLPMNRTSVEEAFRFSYGGLKYDISNGVYQWAHNDRLFSFRSLSLIPLGTMVTVTINYSAHSNEGIQLEETYEWVFIVSTGEYTGNPSVSGCSPPFDDVIFTDIPISITFDREMLRSSVEASFSLISDDFLDSRYVDDGTITWADKTMTFQPNEPLDYDKYYTMSLNDPGVICKDLSGNELVEGFESQFFTIDNAIYVSDSMGDDVNNEGYHSTIPVQTIQEGITKAGNYEFTQIKIADGNYTDDIILNDLKYNDIHFKGGWSSDFGDFNPSVYIPTVSPGSNNFTFTLSDVSGVIIDGLTINGGNAAGPNNGAVLINSGSSGITIQNCSIEGGSAGTTHGILIGSGAQNIIIQNNYSISGGATSNSPAFGIYISDNVSATIQDNDIINGGQTSSSDTYGIRVETGANVDIYRNTIIGGEENSTSTYNNYGIYLNSSGLCNIFNNFIVGGTDSTDPSNSCYGIYINNSDINIINNTINGNGQGGGFNRTSAIRADGTSLSYVVNNILIGGEGFAKYGIELSDTSYLFNNMVIYNNTFYSEKCSTAYLGSLTMFWNTILLMETNYNIVPNKPQNNIDYDELPAPTDVEFVSASDPDYDYSIDPISPDLSSIRDNGYPLGNLSIFSTGVPNDAELDRFRNDRDLSTIDRGAHEFNP